MIERRVFKSMAFVCLAVIAGSVSGAAPKKGATAFDKRVIRFMSSMSDGGGKAASMIGKLHSEEFESGKWKAQSFFEFAALEKSFRLQSVDFFDSEAAIKMVGKRPANHSCYDRLTVWLYPAGTKMNLKYVVKKQGYCLQPVSSMPAPSELN